MKYRASMSVLASKGKNGAKILLAKRNTNRWPNCIVTGPQGRNDGETPYKNIVREVKEECGIDEYVFKQVFPIEQIAIEREDNGLIVKAYLILIDEGIMRKIVEKCMGNGELKEYSIISAKKLAELSRMREWLNKVQPHCRFLLANEQLWKLLE